LEQLEELKARNDYHSIMIDIVKKGDLGDYNIFCKKGMPLVKTYNRLRLMSPPKEIDCSVPIEYCKENDFLRLREMMDSTFEVVGDNIPSDSELLDLIRQESIICSRIEHEVVGFIIFEDKGKTSYIRMVCIDENHRGEKLGYRLMTMYFLIHLEFCGFTLWYKSDNVPAFSLYSKWGYKDEDMHDYIFLI
jgi:GNAT superfamily N-acetyltransferase